jgi:hypothetical protein
MEQTHAWPSALVLGVGAIATLAWSAVLAWLVLHMLGVL